MSERTYKIYVDNVLVAADVSFEYVTIFTQAIFNKFYNEDHLSVTIEREEEVPF